VGALALDDLTRDLQTDDTTVRVALSVLEQAGHLLREVDVPRTVGLRLLDQAGDAQFARFIHQAHLPPNQTVSRRFFEWVAAVQLPAAQVEPQLLAWQTAGWLRYSASGRDLLIHLTSAPPAGAPSVDSLRDQFAMIGRQRVTEIVDYARTRYCRHGYLADYLGGAARQTCGVCDTCGAELPAMEAGLPAEAEQRQLVLTAFAQHGWGRRSLIALLRGDAEAGERAQASSVYGALGFRSESALDKLIDALLAAGALAETPLAHGGIALGLTPLGRQWLRDPH
jgi:hypothetical protein